MVVWKPHKITNATNWKHITKLYMRVFSYFILRRVRFFFTERVSVSIGIWVNNWNPYIRRFKPMAQRTNKFKSTSFRLISRQWTLFSNTFDFNRRWGSPKKYLKITPNKTNEWWLFLISPFSLCDFFSYTNETIIGNYRVCFSVTCCYSLCESVQFLKHISKDFWHSCYIQWCRKKWIKFGSQQILVHAVKIIAN